MKHFLYPVLLALALVCGFTACGTPTYITAGIRIDVTRVERASDGTVNVTWRIANPNVMAYVIARSTHKLSLNGTQVGTLADDTRIGVPPNSYADRTTVLTANPAAAAILDRAIAQGSATYNVDSGVYLLIEEDKHERIPFKNSGTTPVVAK